MGRQAVLGSPAFNVGSIHGGRNINSVRAGPRDLSQMPCTGQRFPKPLQPILPCIMQCHFVRKFKRF